MISLLQRQMYTFFTDSFFLLNSLHSLHINDNNKFGDLTQKDFYNAREDHAHFLAINYTFPKVKMVCCVRVCLNNK